MWCPLCQSEKTKVIGTDKSSIVERYRKCDDCHYTFATVESVKHDPNWAKSAAYTDEAITEILKKRHPKQRDMINE